MGQVIFLSPAVLGWGQGQPQERIDFSVRDGIKLSCSGNYFGQFIDIIFTANADDVVDYRRVV